MKMLVTRVEFGDDSTLGKLFIVDEANTVFECYTLEDERRDKKIPGETAIPPGVYVVKPRTEGGMTKKYAARYGDVHVGMAHLQSVPNFKYVYIHTGNTDDHTEGCILVGVDYKADPDGKNNHVIYGSRKAYVHLYKKIAEAWKAGEEVIITVTDEVLDL